MLVIVGRAVSSIRRSERPGYDVADNGGELAVVHLFVVDG